MAKKLLKGYRMRFWRPSFVNDLLCSLAILLCLLCFFPCTARADEDDFVESDSSDDLVVPDSPFIDNSSSDESLVKEEPEDEGLEIPAEADSVHAGDVYYEALYGKDLTKVTFAMKYAFSKDYGIPWGESTYDERYDFIKDWEKTERELKEAEEKTNRDILEAQQRREQHIREEKAADEKFVQDRKKLREDRRSREQRIDNEKKANMDRAIRKMEELKRSQTSNRHN